MSADRWRQAKLHEALEVLLARHRENFSPAEVREVEQAILALREADRRGAQQVSNNPLNATADPRSAPHLPGRQTLITVRSGSGVGDGPPPLITSALPGPASAPGDMVLVPRKTMRLIRLAFLPANPNRMRAADPDVVAAAREFIALAAGRSRRRRVPVEERSRG